MQFVWFLLKQSRNYVILAALTGILSGLANAKVIVMISESLSLFDEGGGQGTFKLFLGVVLLALGAGMCTQIVLIHLMLKLTYHLRLNMSYQIMKLPLRQSEQVGISRLMVTFTQDIPAISGALLQIPSLSINGAIVLGCLGYLGLLSPSVLLLLLVFLVFSITSYLIPEKIGVEYMKRTRKAWDVMLKRFTAMTEGGKELRLSHSRQRAFFEDVLTPAAQTMRDTGYVHRILFGFLGSWVQMLYFFFVGLLLFIVPYYVPVDARVMAGFVLIALYIRSPVSLLTEAIPSFRNANIAFDKIRQIGLKMLVDPLEKPFSESEKLRDAITNWPPLETIRLKNVTYTFFREKENSRFTLGPIDLTLNRGELVFVIGGNGSGKTTLAKLLTGLYEPESGEVLYNGRPLQPEDMQPYREQFSVIFNDFFVFEQLLGIDKQDLDERARTFLQKLRIDHKITIQDGVISNTELSTGQRKRLALLTAFLEDRSIYVFDEWAADQDPEFKVVFYREILPELKARGYTVVAISHDDRFFGLADRVVKLTDGKLDSDFKH